MPCRPRTASLRAGSRCLIELRSICSEASDRRSGASRDASNASIGSKESIRGPVCFHSQLRLARDCQKLPETGKYQKVPANTETPPQLREFPSIYALSPTQLSHSLNPIIEDHNTTSKFSFVRLRNILESQRRRLLSRISPVAYSWSRVAVRTHLSLLTGTVPCLAGLKLGGYSTVVRYA